MASAEKVEVQASKNKAEVQGELPPYCCAILVGSDGCLFVEERGEKAEVARGKRCCFGGKREKGEDPLTCIQRELIEEMNWNPPKLERKIDFYVDGELIAYFYEGEAPKDVSVLKFEESRGRYGVWVEWNDKNISPWHLCVLEAWKNDEQRADFKST